MQKKMEIVQLTSFVRILLTAIRLIEQKMASGNALVQDDVFYYFDQKTPLWNSELKERNLETTRA